MLITIILLFLFFTNFIIVENIEKYNHDENNCNSSSHIQIGQNTPELLLIPPEANSYNISCEWKIHVNTLNETFMLKIDANLVLSQNAFLIITVCEKENILLNSNSDDQYYTLFTQEEELCVNFTSSLVNYYEKKRIYYWSIYFKLIEVPMKKNVRR
jgi:hypothetical protein